jgi:hypothetical protein
MVMRGSHRHDGPSTPAVAEAAPVQQEENIMGKNWSLRVLLFGITAAAVGIGSQAAVPQTVTAQNISSRGCSNRTLQGDYGIAVSGIRAAGPTATEAFVGTGIRTYDGEGNFTQVDNTHGATTGVSVRPANGTYEVNADCSGRSLIYPTGAAVVIETSFVIVHGGDEVHDAVMRPLANMVTAVARRVR